MRILALHGYGTSGQILKFQMAPLLEITDGKYEFVFVDGRFNCKKAPGVPNFVPGPFFCFSPDYSTSQIQEVHNWISKVIEDQGPFDGVLGFSDGAAMTLSYLLQHVIRSPQEPPPFKFAIFFSTVAAFSPDGSYCRSILKNFTQEERSELQRCFPNCNFDSFTPEARVFCKTLANIIESGRVAGVKSPAGYRIGTDDIEPIPRALHPQLLGERIRTPTVYVTGRQDLPVLRELFQMNRELFDNQFIRVIEHEGGHNLPRKLPDIKAVIVAIEWAIKESQNPNQWKSNL